MAVIPPDMSQCTHCKSFMAEGVMTPNARSEIMITVSMIRVPGDTLAYALCGMCSLLLGEFLEPRLKESEEWQSGIEAVRRAMENREDL